MPGRERRRGAAWLAAALAIATFTGAGSAGAQPPPIDDPVEARPIRLVTGDVDRATVETLAAGEAGTGRYIVQFDRPVSEEDAAALEEGGALVQGYLPDFAFAVRVPEGASLPEVDGVGAIIAFAPEWRLSPSLPVAGGLIRIRVDDGVDPLAVAGEVDRAGVSVLRVSGQTILAATEGPVTAAVSAHPAVAWVEGYTFPELHNEEGGAIVGAPDAWDLGYDGSTQIVAVADTGLGDGTSVGAHPDIPAGRIVDIVDYPGVSGICAVGASYTAVPDGAQDVDSGHGTHTTGSVLSDGNGDGLGTGIAPAARLVFQAVEDYADMGTLCEFIGYEDGYYLLGLPLELGDLLDDAYERGARIHSDSWGSDVSGEYTEDSAAVDEFTWANPDFLVVTSAGNSGVDADENGVVDDDSIGSPATAKNLVTVGASEGARPDDFPCDDDLTYVNTSGDSCNSLGGLNTLFTYGEAWPDDYPVPPLSSDPSAGDAEQMAAFSSRGPTDDGRIKPDVVAPGTWILSAYSPLYQEGYGTTVNPQNGLYQYDGWGFPHDADYKYMGGTSMSAPIVAGGAAVIRDYYNQAEGIEASAALVKATLINSAVDLADEDNNPSSANIPIPNDHEGWGRIDLAAATDGSHDFVDGDALGTGGSHAYQVAAAGAAPLRITLVWSDYPSSESAAVNLVNDLDLAVTAPDGTTTYLGNVFAGGWAATGGSADRTNNVENVYVQSAAAGTWTIEVSGATVPFGPQPYAVVIDGAEFTDTAAPTWPAGAELTVTGRAESSIDVSWPAATDDVGVTGYSLSVDGVLATTGDATEATATGLSPDTEYTLTVVARDGAGNTSEPLAVETATTKEGETDDLSSPTWTEGTASATGVLERRADLSWSGASDNVGVTGYDVYVEAATPADTVPTPVASTTGATEVTVDGLEPATTYVMRVVATDERGNQSTDGPAVEFTTATDFSDTNGHIFEDDIAWLAARGITQGCSADGQAFCPAASLTRAQMASLLVRAFDLPAVSGNRFDDVSGVHAANINALAEAGITVGCSPDGRRFCPNDPVRRDQMATFLDRAFGLADATSDYFTDDQGSVHEASINALAASDITLGCDVSVFCPADTVSRGQIAAFIHRGFVILELE